MEAMVGKDTGYVDSFEFREPLVKDNAFKELLNDIYEEVVKEKVRKSYHPSFLELTEQWSGNMRNFVCVSLKGSFVVGLFDRNSNKLSKGLPMDWNDFLLSIGINFNGMIDSTK